MPGRLIGFLATLGAAAGCYSPPEPACGFVCGPGGACPADYTCASDHHCHHDGAPASLTCGTPPADAAPDVSPVDSAPGPQIVSVTPADGATDIGVDTVVQAFADQPLQGTPALSLVFSSSGAAVAGTAQFVGGTGIQFTPDAQLVPNELYGAMIASGVSGPSLPLAPYQWTFRTGADTVPPHVQGSDPAASDTGAAVTTGVVVTFDEQVTGVDATTFTAIDGTTPVTASIAVLDARTYELRPASSLSAGATITVSLSSAIHDPSGNALAPTTFSFTTAP
jgi:hypothetical protein